MLTVTINMELRILKYLTYCLANWWGTDTELGVEASKLLSGVEVLFSCASADILCFQ